MILQFQNQKIFLILSVLLFLTSVSCSRLKSDGYYKKGSRAHNRGDFKAAIELYKKSIAENSTNPEVEYDLGVAYLDSHNYPKADQQIRKLKGMGEDVMVAALQELLIKGKRQR